MKKLIVIPYRVSEPFTLARGEAAPVSQAEVDLLLDHSYQYGAAATCKSSIVKRINAGNYAGSCEAYLMWKFVAGRGCSVRSNGCYGVWRRSQERHETCKAAL